MAIRFAATRIAGALTLTAGLSLAACGEAEEPTYEVDATDESGGELIVADEDPEGVAVDLPETEMTNVPPEQMAGDDMADGNMGEETAAPDE